MGRGETKCLTKTWNGKNNITRNIHRSTLTIPKKVVKVPGDHRTKREGVSEKKKHPCLLYYANVAVAKK